MSCEFHFSGSVPLKPGTTLVRVWVLLSAHMECEPEMISTGRVEVYPGITFDVDGGELERERGELRQLYREQIARHG